MGLESATYIHQLDPTNPVGATDTKAQGDDHLRLLKSSLLATFPGITGAITVTHTQINTVVGAGVYVPPGYATPTAQVGLSAIAGSAATAMRSDAAPVIDQTIAPTWSARHIYSANSTGANGDGAIAIAAAVPAFTLRETGAAANNRAWVQYLLGEALHLGAVNDANTVITDWCVVLRTGTVIDSVEITAPLKLSTAGEGLSIEAATPVMRWYETDGPSDEKLWRVYASAGLLVFDMVNDAFSGAANWMTVDRAGNALSKVDLAPAGGLLTYANSEVGYRNLIDLSFSTSGVLADIHRGKMLRYLGGAGNTLTCPSSFSGGEIFTLMNNGSGSLSIVAGAGATLHWANGSGAFSSGVPRTLAVAGVATVWYISASTITIWGSGLS